MGSQVSSQLFDWNSDRRIFVAESSDLPTDFRFESVYQFGATQAGFTMVSDASGDAVRFVMSSIDKSGGDVAGWRFVPSRDSIKRIPKLAGVTALIIND